METGTNMLTVAAVARRLAVSVSTVYKLLGKGTIPHFKVGGRKVVSPLDLERYLEDCRVASVAEERAAAGAPLSLQERRQGKAA
jgi:excisionase family DNA binding protein